MKKEKKTGALSSRMIDHALSDGVIVQFAPDAFYGQTRYKWLVYDKTGEPVAKFIFRDDAEKFAHMKRAEK